MRLSTTTTSILLPFLFFTTALASAGDRSPVFTRCVSNCKLNVCQSPNPPPLPLSLRLTRWTCFDDCKYTCMHQITALDVSKGLKPKQYHGKWPFYRYAGMQEPASVLFSILNMVVHLRGWKKVRREVEDGHPMKGYYLTWSVVSVNAWIWSSVFHTRDLPTTEKLDYFSAALAIMYALYYTVIRLFHLYPLRHAPRPLTSSQNHATATQPPSTSYKAWRTLCTLAYIAHISYLTLLPRFDYTYNMAFNLFLGLSHNFLWLLYSLPISSPSTLSSILTKIHFRRFPSRPHTYRPSFTSKASLFVLLTTLATALELFDFPPWWGVIDAHALWHLSTVPIAEMWYWFLVEDSKDGSWRELEKSSGRL
ncbi:hypothetical protein AX16_003960 [Volvariella volvacea WC 439]|nr:hypothetical protein AX16_003960 [Volvariella volvacea WC 439]